MRSSSSSEFGHDNFGGIDLGPLIGATATGIAQAAGVDPTTIKAAQDVLSSPIAKAGFNVGMNVAVGAVAKGMKGAPSAVHADPSVVAAKAALPVDAHAGFDAGAALAAAHVAGGVIPGLTPAAQAAQLIAVGTPPPAPKLSWMKLGATALVAGGVAALLGANLPIVAVAVVVGPGVLHVFGKDKA